LRRSLLFTGVHVNSYASMEKRGRHAYVNVGRHARLKNVVIDRGVRIPEGLVVGEDPESRCQKRFRTTAQGITLITQPMIDRLDADVRFAFSRSPRKFLSDRQNGRPCRRHGALPGCVAGQRYRNADPGARLSRCHQGAFR